ncbi:MAG: penicillin-binding protein, partial [Rickettsiales bacterium]
MLENNTININEAKEALDQPIVLDQKNYNKLSNTNSFSESVRREIISMYGTKNLYEAGLSIHTTLDTNLQIIAEKSFRNGIINYDKKHGYRGS